MFDIKNASTVVQPIAAPDVFPTTFPTGLNAINELVRNLQVTTSGGFTMTIWSANASGRVLNYPGSTTTNALYEIYPSYTMHSGYITPYTAKTNVQVGSNSWLSLVTFRVNRDIASSQPFTASARYYNNIPNIPAVPMPIESTGPVSGDGTIIWLHPLP